MENNSFPPIDAIVTKARSIDFNAVRVYVINAAITALAFVAAVFTVIKAKWIEHDGAARMELAWDFTATAVKDMVKWAKEIAIPEVKGLYNDVTKGYDNTLQFAKEKGWV
jgi:hypothetical protein